MRACSYMFFIFSVRFCEVNMSMHLVKGVYVSSSNKRKPTTIPKSKMKRYQQDLAARNKQLKQQGRHSEIMSIDEYIAYVTGRAKPRKQQKATVSPNLPQQYRPDQKFIPSIDTGAGTTPKIEPKQYTGTLIKGLMTMHKSNLVPVINEDEIIAITKMRR